MNGKVIRKSRFLSLSNLLEATTLHKMGLLLVLVFTTGWSATSISAQTKAGTRTVKGTVVEASDGEPMIGVTIWVKDTSVGTVTDLDGQYTIQVPLQNNVLVFTAIGFNKQEIVIGEKNLINVKMSESKDSVLDEVVVVGYGTQKRESIIGSISTIDANKLKVPSSKISNVLAGQLSGVVSMNRSGEPGAGSEFYIRGISTFGSNKTPLVLVDGVERSLDLVDPEDIETFSVLKDATATAVYGVRGANGVLLITTRKGQEGKPRISVRAEAGIITPTKMPKYANSAQWAEMYNEAYGYDNNGAKFYSDEVIQKYKDGSDNQLYPNVNWMKALYKNWSDSKRANVNVSGGGTMVRYYVAGSIYDESSIFRDRKKDVGYDSSMSFNKVNFRANLDVNLTTTTILNLNLANIYEKKNLPGEDSDRIWNYAARVSPNAYPTQYADGKHSGPTQGTGFNPYNLLMYSGYQEQYWNNSQALVGLTQDFSMLTEGLKANIKFSWDALNFNSIKRGTTPMQYLATGRDENGDLIYSVTNQGSESLGYEKSNTGNKRTYLEASLNYDHIFNDVHNIGALFLFNQTVKNDVASGTAIGSLPFKTQGLAGRVTYAFKDRYFSEVNMGYNGSENFAPGHRFGFFPAAAVGWLVSGEEWWEPIRDKIDVLKARVSYGKVGNDQIGGGRRFIYESTIKNSDGYTFNNNGSGIPTSGLQVGEVANPNVGWEVSTKLDAGLEISIMRSLRMQTDVFFEDRKGIFMQRKSIPGYAGIVTQPWVNVGRMKNRGFDTSVEYDKKVGPVMVNARGTFTFTHNKIVENDEPAYFEAYRNRVGHRYGQYFGYQSLGFFQSYDEIYNSPAQFGVLRPGDVKYKDINGDGKVSEEDQIAIGYSSIPEILYGFGSSFQYKNLDFSFFFQGAGRVSILVSGGDAAFKPFSTGNMGQSGINEDIYHGRWTTENSENAKYPRLSLVNSTNNNVTSTMWLHNGSFLRLKTAEIGYKLPKSIIEKSFIGSARFYLTGINLLTFSGFKLWDPERGSGAGNAYPPVKTITIGLSLNI